MNFYRLKEADFTTFEGAYENTALKCDKKAASNPLAASTDKMDGRAYQLSIREMRVNEGPAGKMVKMFDYPSCALNGDVWNCNLYLPAKAKQTDSYPAFIQPGVITGYYVSSYFPGVKLISYVKSTQLVGQQTKSGDIYMTTAVAIAATLAIWTPVTLAHVDG